MKVAISCGIDDLDAAVSPVFGRCNGFLLVDTLTMQHELFPNPAIEASGGAGVQAAEFVARQGAEAVISGNMGPNAMGVFSASGILVYSVEGGTVREALAALQAGTLQSLGDATVSKDFGKGGSAPGGRGLGRGQGRR